jgi:hypothetical protein
MLGILFLNIFSSGDASLSMSVPKEVNAGAEFDIQVVLKKGTAESFARFQQELPRGLSAQVVENPNANFAFEDQKVKFLWLRLPVEEEIKISYRVRVDERLKGNFTIGGVFSYIVGNERKSIDVNPSSVSIRPSTKIDPTLIVDISEYQQMVPAQPPVSLLASNVRCIRQNPQFIDQGNDMRVNILVNKGSTEKFAKIEEIIPSGYTAEAINTRDAIFTYKDNIVKFLWMNLPPEERFIVNYRLAPDDGIGKTDLPLKGTFSFILNGATQVIEIVQRDADLNNLDSRYLDGVIASVPSPGFKSPVGSTSPTITSYTETGTDGGKEIPVMYRKIEDKPHAARKQVELDMSYLLEPEEGVYYRVQIAAGHRPVDMKRYFRRLNITDDVRTEKHEGWYKYSIGSFGEYKEARDYRVKIWNTTPIDDAFVAAYNNGIRITVQEALMITNQPWFK